MRRLPFALTAAVVIFIATAVITMHQSRMDFVVPANKTANFSATGFVPTVYINLTATYGANATRIGGGLVYFRGRVVVDGKLYVVEIPLYKAMVYVNGTPANTTYTIDVGGSRYVVIDLGWWLRQCGCLNPTSRVEVYIDKSYGIATSA